MSIRKLCGLPGMGTRSWSITNASDNGAAGRKPWNIGLAGGKVLRSRSGTPSIPIVAAVSGRLAIQFVRTPRNKRLPLFTLLLNCARGCCFEDLQGLGSGDNGAL